MATIEELREKQSYFQGLVEAGTLTEEQAREGFLASIADPAKPVQKKLSGAAIIGWVCAGGIALTLLIYGASLLAPNGGSTASASSASACADARARRVQAQDALNQPIRLRDTDFHYSESTKSFYGDLPNQLKAAEADVARYCK